MQRLNTVNSLFKVFYSRKHISVSPGRMADLERMNVRNRRVQKHVISVKEGKRHFCGKIYLPEEVTRHYKKEMRLLSIKHPIHIKNSYTWGKGYLLLLVNKGYDSAKSYEIRAHFNIIEKEHDCKRLMRHKRRAKGKEYSSYKIFVPKQYYNKEVEIYRIRPIAYLHLGYREEQSGTVKTLIQLKGRSYLLLIKQTHKQKNKSIDLLRAEPRTRRYETTLAYLRQNKKTYQIAELTRYSENTIWNHIVRAYREDAISSESVKLIIQQNIGIKDDITIELSEITRAAELRLAKIKTKDAKLKEQYRQDIFQDALSVKGVTAHYEKVHKVKLMPNMAQCMCIIYKELLGLKDKSYY